MTPFNYARASSAADAVRLAGAGSRPKYLGGGTNLVDLMHETIERPHTLVDVTPLSSEIEATSAGGLYIGAAATNTAVAGNLTVRERYPMLSRAILAGASAQIRNMATVGGNLLQRTRCLYFYDETARCNKRRPGTGCDAIEGFSRNHAILGASPACIATHPSDMCVALVALDAIVHIEGIAGPRSMPLTDLHRLPGDHPEQETVLSSSDLITAIELPALPFAAKSIYRKVRDRASYAFALVSVAAALDVVGGQIRDVRLALGGVAAKPWRAYKAESALRGQWANDETLRAAADAELADAVGLRHNEFKIELARRTLMGGAWRAADGTLMSVIQKAAQKVLQTAIAAAPESWLPGGTPDPLMENREVIGAPVSRVDGPLKVMGKARFAAEVPLPGMLYAVLSHSSIARGQIARIDTAAAERCPGVALVMTHRNAPRMKPPALFGSAPGAAGPSTLPIMQDASIHWNGEAVAVVLAETLEQAEHAASLIDVAYESQPSVTSFEIAKTHSHPPDSILGEPPELVLGDVEAALASSIAVVDRTYRTPRHNHNAIELHAATALWEADQLTLHDASQLVNATASTLAGVFSLKPEQVRIMSPYVGGGFGGKCLWSHQILAAAAAKLAGRPVRMMLSREGVFRIVGGRTTTEQRVVLGAKADGTLSVLMHTGVVAMTAHNACPEQFSFPARHLYSADAMRLAQEVAEMDMLANTFMRAPGESVGTFALECAIDELSEQLKLDPIELRRRIEPQKDPTSGKAFSSRHLLDAYAEGAKRFGWEKRRAAPRSHRDGEWLIGMGVATGTYPYYRFPGGAARIRLSADGHVKVSSAMHEMGMGTATVQTQHIAARLGLPLDHVTFEYGDTALPAGSLAGGSSQTASVGAAIIAATESFFKELLKLSTGDSPLFGLKAHEVEGHKGGIGKLGDPARFESYVSILKRAKRSELIVEAQASKPLEVQKYSMHSYAAQFCEVRVSAMTGEIRVSRFLGSFDCGRILNAKTAASQFKGGIIMGLGLALTEDTYFDERTGRIMNPSLAEYHVPVHMDVPAIEVIWTDIPDPHSPIGAHGIGEIGITGVAAAVANAVYNATGKRVRDLPITLDKVM